MVLRVSHHATAIVIACRRSLRSRFGGEKSGPEQSKDLALAGHIVPLLPDRLLKTYIAVRTCASPPNNAIFKPSERTDAIF